MNNLVNMQILILSIPFLAWFYLSFLNSSGKVNKFAVYVNIGILLCPLIFSLSVLPNTEFYEAISLGTCFSLLHYKVDYLFLFNDISLAMMAMVICVASLVILYSINYMAEDPELSIFIGYLCLFAGFMLILVTAGNLYLLLFAWEGVGLVSYFLINFWHKRVAANKAAMKAIILNRIGDAFFFIGVAIVFSSFGTVDFPVLYGLVMDTVFAKPDFCFYNLSFLDISMLSFCY